MNSHSWAKELYDDYHQLDLEQLGPMVRGTEATEKQLKDLLDAHKENISKLMAHSRPQGKSIIKLESPWHAWVVLYHWQREIINVSSPDPETRKNFLAPVFRGQANSSYDVTPSFHRKETNQKIEKKKLEYFTLLMNSPEIQNAIGIPLSEFDLKATAQHYQVSLADFVDITGDPAVAIHFACTSTPEKRPESSAVFMFDLQEFVHDGASLVMPPPFASRLYIQRGGFLHINPYDFQRLQNWLVKLEFPHDPDFKSMRSYAPVDLLPLSIWFDKFNGETKSLIERQELTEKSPREKLEKFYKQTLEKISFPEFAFGMQGMHAVHWVDAFSEHLYWFAIRTFRDKDSGEEFESIIPPVALNIAKHNAEVVKELIYYYGLLGKEELKVLWTALLIVAFPPPDEEPKK